MPDLTRVLAEHREGDPTAANRLFEVTYAELRRLAAARMAGERGTQTLQATALVHEAWLRLGGDEAQAWNSRGHFFSAAAEAMRRILVDQARRKRTQRRGARQEVLSLVEIEIPGENPHEDILAIHEVLERLSEVHPERAQLVKLRYFIGLTLEQCAEVQGTSLPTVKRHWTFARAWMLRALQENRESHAPDRIRPKT